LEKKKYVSSGCDGGWADEAFDYIRQFNVTFESSYPFTASDGKCRQNVRGRAVTLKRPDPGFTQYYGGDGKRIKDMLTVSPVVNYFRVENAFRFYNGGIMNTPCKKKGITHVSAIVGYCSYKTISGDIMYWIAKNSWGSDWGEDGYYKIPVMSDSPGICECQSHIVQPTAPKNA